MLSIVIHPNLMGCYINLKVLVEIYIDAGINCKYNLQIKANYLEKNSQLMNLWRTLLSWGGGGGGVKRVI